MKHFSNFWEDAARVFGASLVCLLVGIAHPAIAEIKLPYGPGRDLVYGACRTCHDLQYLTESAGIPRDAWEDVIKGMRQYGLRIPDDRRARILEYLGTYLGPNPPPATMKEQAVTAPETLDPALLYETNCAACHQPDGKGVAGQFPPLAGNRDLFRDRMLPVHVLLNGIAGPVQVGGEKFNAEMPSMAHLTDAEIATLIEYVRGAWNNGTLRPHDMAPIEPATVEAERAKKMTPADVHAYRARLQ